MLIEPPSAQQHVDIAVVGGGASAVLFVAALRHHASHDMPSVVIVDPADTVGLGPAYRTTDQRHRLNVRSAGLSAVVDDPDHFVRWLAGGDPPPAPSAPPAPGQDFALRSSYGAYLCEVLANCAGSDVTHLQRRVTSVDQGPDSALVHLDGGDTLVARRVVLAIGVPTTAPARFAVDDAVMARGSYVADPWAPDALAAFVAGAGGDDPLGAGATAADPPKRGVVALVGTGLTCVDMALSLSGAGWDIVAISPHGRLPERHEPVASPALATLAEPPEVVTASSFIHWVRTSCVNEPNGWRAAMDALRFRIEPVWQATPVEQRRRLLQRVGAVWHRHRHRIAPDVAEAIDALMAQGRMRVECGRVVGIAALPDQAHVLVQRVDTDGSAMDDVVADVVVNCAGAPGIHSTTSGLTRRLLHDGVLTADALGLGVTVDPTGRALAPDGTPSAVVTVVGALRHGAEAESIAIPDLRTQADVAACRMLQDLTVW